MITTLKVVFSALLVFISYEVVSTSMQSNLFDEWNYLSGIPWMRATLWDFYANVFVLSVWVCYKESKFWKKFFWIIGFCLLGSIATCAYVLVQLFNAKDDDPLKAIFARQN